MLSFSDRNDVCVYPNVRVRMYVCVCVCVCVRVYKTGRALEACAVDRL